MLFRSVSQSRYKACDERFLICIKPFNVRSTFLYSIVDLKENKRGTDNYKCYTDYDSIEECKEALKLLNNGKLTISTRTFAELEIERIDPKSKKG